ncbi:MAG: component of SufBCD complex [Rhodobacteraceae bacterium]|nr:component of SufBCD complex [Paracoccaceae bacterium]
MDLYQSIVELIDLRSFSNLWYWIILAILWFMASHSVLGVPYDLVLRARRHEGAAQVDLEDMIRINVSRILYMGDVSGVLISGIAAFVLTGLVLLGFVYGVEFAQAVFLLVFPMSIVGMLSVRQAWIIRADQVAGANLRDRLGKHRLHTQIIGTVSIFCTALWGMYQNLAIGVWGN